MSATAGEISVHLRFDLLHFFHLYRFLLSPCGQQALKPGRTIDGLHTECRHRLRT